ncbi:MAG: CARDB domain-containing protein [Tepidisphaeraceae bacterium]
MQGNSGGTVLNQGTVQADVNGGTITLNGTGDQNLGNLKALNGATLSLPVTIANAGTVTVDGTSYLNGNGSGTLSGGILAPLTGASLYSITLDAVTANGNWQVTGNNNVTVKDGLTLNGTLSLGDNNGNIGYLNFSGNQSLGGTGSVVFGNSTHFYNGTNYNGLFVTNSGTTLTIANGVTVRGQLGYIGYNSTLQGNSNSTVVDQGTIQADVNNGTITFTGTADQSTGTLKAVNGGTLTLQATGWIDSGINESDANSTINLSGSFANAGNTIALSGPGTIAVNGTITGGTVNVASGTIFSGTGGTLDGVTVNGNWQVTGNNNLTVKDGLSLNGAVSLGDNNGNIGYLNFTGSQSLGGTGSVVFGNATHFNNGTNYDGLFVTNSGTTLTIANGVTVRGQLGYIGNNDSLQGNSGGTVLNQGTVQADVNGGTITLNGTGDQNLGILGALNGATLLLSAPVAINGQGVINSAPSGSILVNGNLLGTTTNAAGWNAQSPVTFNGSGTASSPQLLEAMSQDDGASAAGFQGNFAYGALNLSNGTYVRLVDQSQNAASGANAVYCSSLNVPAGTTLDLNGLHLYTLLSTGSGTVLNGTITVVPGSGLPDLSPQSVNAASNSNGLLNVTWNDVNGGGGAVTGSFYDQVQLIDATNGNAVLDSHSVYYNEGSSGPITFGGGYAAEQTSFNLANYSAFHVGDALQVAITTDVNNNIFESNKANNRTTATVTQAPLPDLRVTGLTMTGDSSGNVTVAWNDYNAGGGLVATTFNDRVVVTDSAGQFSYSTTITPTDSGNLAAGASGAQSVSFRLPNGFGATDLLSASVTVNSGGSVFESNSANNTNTLALTVPLATYADLQVAGLGISGDSLGNVSVHWNDTNAGGAAVSSSFTDQVIVIDSVTSQQLYSSTFNPSDSGNLAAGASSPQSITFRLPTGFNVNDALTATVTINANHNVFESNLNNNAASFTASAPLTGYPDLQVTGLGITGDSLGNVSVQWNDTNSGGAAVTSSFSDQVIVIDSVTSQQLYSSTFNPSDSGNLAAGASSPQSISFRLPTGFNVSDPLTATVTVNANHNVFESNLNNNTASFTASAPLSSYPDLQVTSLGITGDSLGNVSVQWNDTNAGGAAVTSSFTDQVIVIDSVTSQQLYNSTFNPSDSGNLAAGASSPQSISLRLPSGFNVNDPIKATVTVNSGVSVFESNSNNNTASLTATAPLTNYPDLQVTGLGINGDSLGNVSVLWNDSNSGGAAVTTAFTDQVIVIDAATSQQLYSNTFNPSDSGNLAAGASSLQSISFRLPTGFNVSDPLTATVTVNANHNVFESNLNNNTASFTASAPLSSYPDLQVTSLGITGDSLGNVSVQWNDTNAGGAAVTSSFTDQVIVIDSVTSQQLYNSTFNPSDSGNLAAGASSLQSISFRLPTGFNVSDPLTATVTVNANHNVFESNLNDNASQINTTSPLASYPDLAVTALALNPASPQSGQTVTINWMDSNIGAATAVGTWSDQVTVVNVTSGQTLLDTSQTYSTNNIAPGGSVARSAQFQLPDGNAGVGQLSVTVKVDSGNQIFEYNPQTPAENNNVSQISAAATLAPYPDLQVTGVSAPATGYNGQSAVISWTDINNGTAAANGPWVDSVYAAADAQGDGKQLLGTFTFAGTLAVGDSVQRSQQVYLPSTPGTYWIHVTTNATQSVQEGNGFGNDTTAASDSILINQVPLPDLVVTSVTPPPNGVLSGTTVPVTFAIKNEGTAATSVPVWQDWVILSQDPTLAQTYGPGVVGPGSDQTLNNQPVIIGFNNPSYLGVGQSYANTVNVPLPATAEGTWYVYVVPDGTGGHHPPSMQELSRTDKLAISDAFTVTLSPFPDLAVSAVTAPAQNFSGQSATIQWTVSNNGAAQTAVANWTDAIYMSSSPTFDSSATQLGRLGHQGTLAPGASYDASASVTLPVGVSGQFYFFVRTDVSGQVFENGMTANNVAWTAASVTVNLTPPPDLEIQSIVAPSTASANHNFSFKYTAVNAGAGATPNYTWTDSFYLSPTASYDSTTVVFLGFQTHVGSLAAGASYSANVTVPIPLAVSGNYYLIVNTDSGNQVFELNKPNNIGASTSTIAVSSIPADLVVTSVSGPSSAVSGVSIPLNWVVANQGAGDTGNSTWKDSVYITAKSTFDSTATLLSSFTQSSSLSPGGSYSRSESVTLPINLAGDYNIFVVTNSSSLGFETNLANNVSAPIALTLQSGGGSQAQVSDLQPVSISAPATVTTGGTANVSWTVINNGPGTTNSNYWNDDIWLSTNTSLGSGGTDIYLGSVQHTNALASGANYTASGIFTVPRTPTAGNYYFILAVDRPVAPPGVTTGENLVYETNKSNNTLAASSPTSVTVSTPAELTVTNVAVPASVSSGGQLSVGWTVHNAGGNTGNVSITDSVYLSLDQVLDTTDRYLGSVTTQGGLNAGASYSQMGTFSLASGLAGTYYVIVETNSNQAVYEVNAGNDTAASAAAVQINLPALADLAAGTVTIPATAVAGQNITITYQVTNVGANAASGSWTDSLYLSSSPTWTVSDPLLGHVYQTQNLGAGDSYTGTLTAPLPGVAPGNYYVILRTNILNTLPEITQSNNLSASVTQTAIDAPALTLSTPTSGFLSTGQSVYYKVVVAANETLDFSLTSQAASASNELYVSYGTMPTRADYDYRYSQPFQANQQITVPNTQAGSYYVLIYGNSVPGNAENYSITASAIPFSITAVANGTVDNSGPSTIEISGALFDRATTFQLVDAVNNVLPATNVYFQDSGTVFATFNFTGRNPGSYALQAMRGDGTTAQFSGAVTVVAAKSLPVLNPTNGAQNGALETYFVAPTISLPNRVGSFQLVYTNISEHDIVAPLLTLTSTDKTAIGLTPTNVKSVSYLSLLGTSPDGPAGILRPGESVSKTFYFKSASSAGSLNDIEVQVIQTNDMAPLNLKPYLPASVLLQPNFDAIYANLQQAIGSTWGTYVNVLAQNATLLPAVMGNNSDPTTLLQISVERATAALGTSISGTIFADDPNVALAGQTITAVNQTTHETYSSYSLNDGSFIFPVVDPGAFVFHLPNALIQNPPIVTVADGQQVTGVTLNLTAATSISGHVVNYATSKPSSGITVSLYDSQGNSYATTTDNNGYYQINGLASGDYSLTASDSTGVGFSQDTVALTAPNATTLDISYGEVGAVSGTISFAGSAPSDSQISVIAFSADGQKAYYGKVSNGSFNIADLPAGSYSLRVEAEGYAPLTISQVTTMVGQTTNLGTVSLGAGASISGSVELDGQPVSSGLDVIATLDGGTAVDMFNGTLMGNEFTINSLPAGTYTIYITDNASDGLEVSSTVTAGQQQDLGALELAPAASTASAATQAAVASSAADSAKPAGLTQIIKDLQLAKEKAYLLAVLIPGEAAWFGLSVANLWLDFITSSPSSPTPEQYFSDGSDVVERWNGYRNDSQIQGSFSDLLYLAANRIAATRLPADYYDLASGGVEYDLCELIKLYNALHPGTDFYSPWTVPGNTAGEEGSWVQADGTTRFDDRILGGSVFAYIEDVQETDDDGNVVDQEYLVVESQISMTVIDSIDFHPGDLGSPLEQFLFTTDLKDLEDNGWSYGVPFTVELTDNSGNMVVMPINSPQPPDSDNDDDNDDEPPPPPSTPPDDSDNPDDSDDPNAPDSGGDSDWLTGTFEDPNNILGPSGFGSQKYVAVSQPLNYTINFENKPTATLPVPQVVITQHLDPNLDARTFRLGSFGWGGQIFQVPANSAYYQTTIDRSQTLGYDVQVTATIDVSTDTATWVFTTIDPATGEMPVDPRVGFLPPDDAIGSGEGFVSYTVVPNQSDPTGTVVNAQATVVFSTNPPMDTPQISNTIDAGTGLTSSVAALPAIEFSPTFNVSWSGSEAANGSAVASYSIYVSDNGGPFTAWLSHTTLTSSQYVGALGHTYSFYSIANDNVGNVQATPASAQASTLVLAAPTLTISSPPGSLTYDGASDVTSWVAATLTGVSGIAPPTGPVQVLYFNGASASGSPLASPPVNAGTYTVVATYAGDANYASATSNAVTFTITRASVVVTLPTPPASIVYDGTNDVTAWVTATVTGPSGAPAPSGAVTYTYYSGTSATGTPLSAAPVNAGTYTVVANYAGNSNYLPRQSASVTFTITQPVAPLSVYFTVDDGTAQRSMVRSLTVAFSSAVTLQSGAITLTDSSGNAVAYTLSTADNITFRLTFVGGQFIGGSLANGRYVLTVHASKVSAAGGAQLSSDQMLNFWRFFGDFYGTGSVNNADKTLFTQVYRGQATAYLAYFDYDGNGVLNATDTNAFNQDFGRSI